MTDGALVAVGSAALRTIWQAIWASLQVEIQNQCSSFELTSPVYFCDGSVCDIPLDQSIAFSNSMQTRFKVDLSRFMFQGAILYRLNATSTSPDETDTSNATTETSGDDPISMQLLVAWKVSRISGPHLFALLIENDRDFTWNEDKLRKFIFEEYSNRFKVTSGRDETTWLTRDGTVLKIETNIMTQKQYKLHVIISKGIKDIHTTNALFYEVKS
jgi:hypothetical protein